ncbi:MAG TPA: HypC/HybG/HupF family hydrogenase formation chaperone [Gemmatimonadaceae bacterium]|nr:HypC/HybG/HupF family hydrogenase formation chaperone [Gemmatimonadaceae bacterium]
MRATIVAIDDALATAAPVAGALVTVALDFIEAPRVGDVVMVHQGFAIARVDP